MLQDQVSSGAMRKQYERARLFKVLLCSGVDSQKEENL